MLLDKKRYSEEIADAIQKKILELELQEGDRLPTHATLARELNVSIPTLREGLQTLTTLGVVKILHGVGTIVVKPKISHYFKLLEPIIRSDIQSNTQAKEELLEFRLLIEQHSCSKFISQKKKTAKLTDIVTQMEEAAEKNDLEMFLKQERRYHRLIARLSGNRIISEILYIINQILYTNTEIRSFFQKSMSSILSYHRELIKQIGAGNKKNANSVLKDYLYNLGTPSSMAIILDTFSTGSIGGSFYSVGRLLCQILRTHGQIKIENEPTGGGLENVKITSEGGAILGLTQSDAAYHAYHGKYPFSGTHKELRAICGAHKIDLWIVVPSSSTIKNVNDLKGKRIAMGAMGGETRYVAEALLKSFNLFAGDYRPYYLSISNAVHLLTQKEIDAIFYLSWGLGPALSELSEAIDIQLLSIDSKRIDKIIEKNSYWQHSIIESKTHPLITEDVHTIGLSCVLITHRDAPVEIIKNITRVIMEHSTEMNIDSSHYNLYGPAEALNGISIPLHTGALQYYQNKGIING